MKNCNHRWFNEQSEEKQKEMNDAFQEYKKKIDLGIIELRNKKIEQVKKVEIPEKIEEDYISIPVYDNIKEEDKEAYKKLKEDRNKRVYAKFGMEYKGSER